MEMLLSAFLATWRQARRLVVLVVGVSVVAFGVALLVLPGPAFIVIPTGLGILSLEFVWARRWLQKIRESAESAAQRVRDMSNSKSKPEDPLRVSHSSCPGPTR